MYATAIAATLLVRTRIPPSPGSRRGAGPYLGGGVAIVLADKRLSAIMAVTIIYNVFAWPFTSMIPVIGRDRLLLGPEGVGLLTSVDGVGAFVGALVLALWLTPGWHARAYVGGGGGLPGGADCLRPGAGSRPGRRRPAADRSQRCGLRDPASDHRLPRGPRHMRSRILGVLSVCIGTGPIGFLWLGLLADRIGASQATAITGAMGLLALAATYPLWRRI